LGILDGFLAARRLPFVYGVFYGGWVAVLPAVVMDFFGGRNVSGILGVLYTSVAFGTLIEPGATRYRSSPVPARNMIAAGIAAGTSKAPQNSDLRFSIGCDGPLIHKDHGAG